MGTTNVGCVLTGLEIAEADPAYMVMLTQQPMPYEGHWILLPPVKGTYTGLKSLKLTEDLPALELKAGDTIPAEDLLQDLEVGMPAFIHPEVFEALCDIQMDQDGETYGDDEKHALAEVRTSIQAQNIPIMLPNMVAKIAIERTLRFCSRVVAKGSQPLISSSLTDPVRFENALMLFGRARRLHLASGALRAPLVPVNWGPQETDDATRLGVMLISTDIVRRRIAENEALDED